MAITPQLTFAINDFIQIDFHFKLSDGVNKPSICILIQANSFQNCCSGEPNTRIDVSSQNVLLVIICIHDGKFTFQYSQNASVFLKKFELGFLEEDDDVGWISHEKKVISILLPAW